MTWLHGHLTAFSPQVESHIVCQWTKNSDQFPVSKLASAEYPPKNPSPLSKLQRRIGMTSDEERKHLALLETMIQKVKPQLVHSHFGQCGWAASNLVRKYNLKHIVSFYGLDLSYLPRADRRWVTRYQRMSDLVDLVLCEGPHMARCLADLGVDPGKVRLFRLGIDLNRIPFVPRSNKRQSASRFLIAGSFREKKGIPYALEALGMLSKKRADMEITVIGDSGGTEREEYEKRKIFEVVERYGLKAKTRFLGYQPYDVLIGELYKHDVFVSPSVTSSDGDTEGGAPVTIIEAAASGMPVASTLHCDIPFVLSEENQSYLVPERDSASLCSAIERLIQRTDWSPIVMANRRLVEKDLDVRLQGIKLAELYRESSWGTLGAEGHTSAPVLVPRA
jgi:colanic acid/amylovoran biosynthesis glycosyltransferase